MKLSGNRLRMGDGSIRHFGSGAKRARFERVAEAVKRGWRPKGVRRAGQPRVGLLQMVGMR